MLIYSDSDQNFDSWDNHKIPQTRYSGFRRGEERTIAIILEFENTEWYLLKWINIRDHVASTGHEMQSDLFYFNNTNYCSIGKMVSYQHRYQFLPGLLSAEGF